MVEVEALEVENGGVRHICRKLEIARAKCIGSVKDVAVVEGEVFSCEC